MNKFLRKNIICLVLLLSNISIAEQPYILLQSTTSTANSGLYDYLLPQFANDHNIEVRVVAVGTGQALRNARNGDADVLIVHAKNAEQQFIAEGYGVKRFDLMYNDFVIVGPKSDPAKLTDTKDLKTALKNIIEHDVPFASRGDDSGTHKKELSLWGLVNIDPGKDSGTWYRETGAGMGATLNIAIGMQAYTLTDRATWISFGNKQDYAVVYENDPNLFNQYGLIMINPEKHPHVKKDLAKQFINWLLSQTGQGLIASYKLQGQQLFFPNAK